MDTTPTDPRPFQIGILPLPGFAVLSYAATVDPLRAANHLSNRRLYDVTHFTLDAQARSSGAALIEQGGQVGADCDLDLLIVVAGGRPETFENPRVTNWLRRLARRGTQMGGVSGGPVILARAGLMEGRRMTVHWEHAPALAEIAPHLLLERSLYVIDRDRVTCAGGTAPLDLMHALIARHHGAGFAREVSDWFMHTDIRPSGDPQRAGLVERLGTTSAPVLDAVAAMQSHMGDPLTLAQLALIAGVTPRQLNRLFQDRLGDSTMRYYRKERLRLALHLLRGSALSITDIALATGFSGSAHFSTAFSTWHGVPPSRARV